MRREQGHIAAEWTRLSGANSVTVGVNRVRIDPIGGRRRCISRAPRRRSSTCWPAPADRSRGERADRGVRGRAGDCLVHRALEHAHTLHAGPEGLDVLVFGERHYAANTCSRTRACLARADMGTGGSGGGSPVGARGGGRSAVVEELSPRPQRIVNVDVDPSSAAAATWVAVGAISVAPPTPSGPRIKHVIVAPGHLAPPHCHSAEEEIFVVLEGTGALELSSPPAAPSATPRSRRRIPWGSARRSRGPRARASRTPSGPDGLTLLAYGTRDRTTSRITPARTRCTCVASVCSPASSRSTTGTAILTWTART